MNILHVIASVNPDRGGPINGILRQNEACGGREGPVKREIVTLDTPGSAYIEDAPLPVHAMGPSRLRTRNPIQRAANHYGYSAAFAPWLKRNIGRFDAAVVHGLWNYAPFGASQILPKSSTPYFVFPHGMMDPWFREAKPAKQLLKQATWVCGEGRLLAGARSVFFTSEEEQQRAEGVFIGHRYSSEVVPYGASPPPTRSEIQRLEFLAAVPELGQRQFLLFLSRIDRKKGCDLLIQSFASVALETDVDLVIAGPDAATWRPELEALANSLGIGDRVHWAGPLYGPAKWGALYAAEAFILPSHQENFGIAVAEALGCGTPVLISDKVNIWREILRSGAGIVAPDTLEGTSQLLAQWMHLTSAQRTDMAAAALEIFNARFNVTNAGPAIIDRIRAHIHM